MFSFLKIKKGADSRGNHPPGCLHRNIAAMFSGLLYEFVSASLAGDLYASFPSRNPQLLFAFGTFEHLVFGVVYLALIAVAVRPVSV